MSSRIMLAKLRFLQRLIASKPSTIVKQIFTRRLYESMINCKMKGFIPDITRILGQCNLSGELYAYMNGGHFPTKSQWQEMAALSLEIILPVNGIITDVSAYYILVMIGRCTFSIGSSRALIIGLVQRLFYYGK